MKALQMVTPRMEEVGEMKTGLMKVRKVRTSTEEPNQPRKVQTWKKERRQARKVQMWKKEAN